MLRKIIILTVLLFQFFVCVNAFSENNLDNIELSKYGRVYSNEDLATRLRRLETDFFGMSQSGDISTRLENLAQISNGSTYSSFVPPSDDFSVGEKRSKVRRFFDKISSPFYDSGSITGFTPPVVQNGYYSGNSFRNEYTDFLNRNNNYCPFNNRYNNSYHNMHNNYSSFNPNKHRYNRIGMNKHHFRPYRYNNPHYNQNVIIPTNRYSDVATRSSVKILRD